MKKVLHIRRQKSLDEKQYWEDFSYESEDESATVATALMTTQVVWEHSCLQKRCGACAMVINAKPRLACDTRLAEFVGERVTIEPLRKFPVIEDLLVDRSSMMEKLKELSVWLEGTAGPLLKLRNVYSVGFAWKYARIFMQEVPLAECLRCPH